MIHSQALSGHARGRLPFAPEGWPFILPTLAAVIITYWVCWLIPSAILAILLLFMLNFFRDPERDTPEGDDVFISPADGKVIRAETMDAGHQRIDVFMNVFDVHVNRAPMSGRITHMKYITGKFVNAAYDEATDENERNRFEMETDSGLKIAFTQISGLIARRIIAYSAVGDQVKAGQRIGMIRFGSRVNCEIPNDFELCVKAGEQVTAGKTILARKRTDSE
ncbi:MAG: phosphatidylserine decarboxylase family protein [Mariprofundaceae bacterium]